MPTLVENTITEPSLRPNLGFTTQSSSSHPASKNIDKPPVLSLLFKIVCCQDSIESSENGLFTGNNASQTFEETQLERLNCIDTFDLNSLCQCPSMRGKYNALIGRKLDIDTTFWSHSFTTCALIPPMKQNLPTVCAIKCEPIKHAAESLFIHSTSGESRQ